MHWWLKYNCENEPADVIVNELCVLYRPLCSAPLHRKPQHDLTTLILIEQDPSRQSRDQSSQMLTKAWINKASEGP